MQQTPILGAIQSENAKTRTSKFVSEMLSLPQTQDS
jgi:hypothetical protein